MVDMVRTPLNITVKNRNNDITNNDITDNDITDNDITNNDITDKGS